MNYYIVPGAFIITLLITIIVSLSFKRPLRGLWLFVLIVFLATWATQLWIQPVGPVYWGVAWAPLVAAAVFFWLLILALTPPYTRSRKETKEVESTSLAIGVIFWIMLVVLIISIAMGYYRLS